MSEFLYKGCTRRNLPHIHPPDATSFVTFRLAGTVPQSVLRLYHARKKWFEEETKRIFGLKLRNDSPEMKAHERSLLDFQRRWFVKFEEILHQAETGPTWLKDEEIARVVADARNSETAKYTV